MPVGGTAIAARLRCSRLLSAAVVLIASTLVLAVGAAPAATAAVVTRAYVANQGSHTVSVIDTATNTVIAAIPVGNGPRSVAVNLPARGLT